MSGDEREQVGVFDGTDDAQLSEFFRTNAVLLSTMARRLAPPTIDPEDLLSEAIVALLTQYKKGAGPRAHVAAYVIQTMRNRAKDEVVSPRSKAQANIDDVEIAAEPSPNIRRVELSAERALVRGAFARLPQDQRSVLHETVVNGRKPRELSAEFGRNPAAISALAIRGRRNLQRTLLQVVLEEGESAECRAAARNVPQVPSVDPPLHDHKGLPTHFAECEACRKRWARWAALPSLLTLAAALSAQNILFGAAPSASAAESGVRQDSAKRTRKVAAVAIVVIAMTGAIIFANHWMESQHVEPEASVLVEREMVAPGVVQYEVKLDIQVDEWWPTRATISGSAQIDTVHPPRGWECAVTGDEAVCATSEVSADTDEFTVTYLNQTAFPAFALTLEAVTSDGADVTVDARGPASE